ncbi:alpha-L-glutamate ligase [Sphingomonas sp.]|uniref:ATP-grasp domain-containing protein n=1 Tax=Sphingomonas sp. TaxID=28214 RepID=UPI0025E7BDBF|nr:alpha-L-glutamate ligase [Sphingomonas sp.]
MTAPLAVLYEHQRWFEPLFAALERRGIAAAKVDARSLIYDPASPTFPAELIFNRVAMSAPQRDPEHGIFHAMAALDHWRLRGARIINGHEVMAIDASKARQLSLIEGLGLATPPTRVIHRLAELPVAARAIGFPLLVKANIGGAGAGIVRFDAMAEIDAAIEAGTVPQSVDQVLLVQAYIEPRGQRICRMETLGGKFLYAIDIAVDGNFDLCPADACQVPGRSVTMTATKPPPEMVAAAEAIAAAAGLDVGGVEYVIDDRDGTARFYDINALSNFVANPLDVLGWDPHDRLVDFIQYKIEARNRS